MMATREETSETTKATHNSNWTPHLLVHSLPPPSSRSPRGVFDNHFLYRLLLVLYKPDDRSITSTFSVNTHTFIAMPSFAKCVVFLTLSVAANALTTPLMLRGMRHRSVAAHAVAAPMEAVPVHITEPVIAIPEGSGAGKILRRRRSNQGRCSQKSSAASSTPSATLLNPPAAEPTNNSAKAKVATSKVATSTTKKSEATSTTHTSSAATPSTAKSGGKLPSFMSGIQSGQGMLNYCCLKADR